MKKLLTLASLLMLSVSLYAQQSYNHFNARQTPDWFRNGVTYQLMPRCFSEEGTLKGAEKHLERLADMGVTVVYLIPVNVADTDMDQTKWSPRQHKSGFNDPRNPYRAGDYFHVDPEYGTDQDLIIPYTEQKKKQRRLLQAGALKARMHTPPMAANRTIHLKRRSSQRRVRLSATLSERWKVG